MMSNGWTGGQYSLFRWCLGLSLAMVFVQRLREGSTTPWLAATGIVAAVFLAVGAWDRIAATAVWLTLLVSGPLPVSHWLLWIHLGLPTAPYGSWAARGRPDPDGSWRMPHRVRVASWTLLALVFGSGLFHLAPLARVTGVPEVGGLFLVLLLAFDPGWVRPSRSDQPWVLFYDGTCGLCHRTVRFLLAEDREASLRFAPLDSEAFRRAVPEEARPGLPDSLVLRTDAGTLLTRSTAVLRAAQRLGGLWRLLAVPAGWIPRPLRDLVYRWVATVRYRLFSRPEEACPIVPHGLRSRFLVWESTGQ
jgi:predicted DCC family thiol-disulfide oxidoreductase YuxK